MDVPQAFTQRFAHPPEAVFDAIIAACKSLDFTVESSNRELLRVRASVSVNMMTWGEVFVLQVEPEEGGSRLNGSVVTKRGVNLLARGRGADLFDQLVNKTAEKLRAPSEARVLPALDPEVIARLRAAPERRRETEPSSGPLLETHKIVMLGAIIALVVAIVVGVALTN